MVGSRVPKPVFMGLPRYIAIIPHIPTCGTVMVTVLSVSLEEDVSRAPGHGGPRKRVGRAHYASTTTMGMAELRVPKPGGMESHRCGVATPRIAI